MSSRFEHVSFHTKEIIETARDRSWGQDNPFNRDLAFNEDEQGLWYIFFFIVFYYRGLKINTRLLYSFFSVRSLVFIRYADVYIYARYRFQRYDILIDVTDAWQRQFYDPINKRSLITTGKHYIYIRQSIHYSNTYYPNVLLSA